MKRRMSEIALEHAKLIADTIASHPAEPPETTIAETLRHILCTESVEEIEPTDYPAARDQREEVIDNDIDAMPNPGDRSTQACS